MIYIITITDESGAVVAKHEISGPVADLILATIHDEAMKGNIARSSVSAAVTGASSKSAAASL
jgi:hypothetical protein